ncbi:MAG: metal-sulfur cluster assembly factor [Leptospiraceae bacterium]|jgi:metal-sulfur cluster biosynthetic enzyme|nr:metal-sulfur cluster assembly factor [Leptospiraceae bacterium]MCZ8346028.1 metal-sulfur cluster assembly factor [Leptospiraceae bacterium]PJE00978.1 MAG: metal-sulfur cluster biosynthetic enzyme [Leptospira sp.]
MIHLETDLEKAIYTQIENVQDPEIGLPITELGLIYEVKALESRALIKMTYTSMACPAGAQMKAEVEEACLRVDGIDAVEVEIVWSPKWNPKDMASEFAKDTLGIF